MAASGKAIDGVRAELAARTAETDGRAPYVAALIHGWRAMPSNAVASERQDVAACDALAVACSVRLSAA